MVLVKLNFVKEFFLKCRLRIGYLVLVEIRKMIRICFNKIIFSCIFNCFFVIIFIIDMMWFERFLSFFLLVSFVLFIDRKNIKILKNLVYLVFNICGLMWIVFFYFLIFLMKIYCGFVVCNI